MLKWYVASALASGFVAITSQSGGQPDKSRGSFTLRLTRLLQGEDV